MAIHSCIATTVAALTWRRAASGEFLALAAGARSPSGERPEFLGRAELQLGAGLGANGDSKSAVLAALFSTTDRHSVLGTYSFDRDGDTSLRSYGLYKVGPGGNPTFLRTITPPRVL